MWSCIWITEDTARGAALLKGNPDHIKAACDVARVKPIWSSLGRGFVIDLDRVPDFHKQMLVRVTAGKLPNDNYKFRVKSFKVVNGELVVTAQLKHHTADYKDNEHHPGELLLVEKFDGPVKFAIDHVDRLELPPGAKIAKAKILAKAVRVEVPDVKDQKIAKFQAVARSRVTPSPAPPVPPALARRAALRPAINPWAPASS